MQVLGPERRDRMIGLDIGATPSKGFGTSTSNATLHALCEIEESNKIYNHNLIDYKLKT